MITLYSTNCPRCKVIEKKLDLKNIEYSINTNIEEMVNLGFLQAPILKIDDDKFLNFTEANAWINGQ